jgi:hypothetical protein
MAALARVIRLRSISYVYLGPNGRVLANPSLSLAREQFAMQLMRGTQRRHPCQCRFCVLIIVCVLFVGMGVEQDVEEAMKWLTMAATSGNSLSHYELGTMTHLLQTSSRCT